MLISEKSSKNNKRIDNNIFFSRDTDNTYFDTPCGYFLNSIIRQLWVTDNFRS